MGLRIADSPSSIKPQVFYSRTGTACVEDENTAPPGHPFFDDQPTSSIGDVTPDQSPPELVWVGPAAAERIPGGQRRLQPPTPKTPGAHRPRPYKHRGRTLIHPRNRQRVRRGRRRTSAPEPESAASSAPDGGTPGKRFHTTGAPEHRPRHGPGHSNTIFAANVPAQRTGWGFTGGGPGSGVYRTFDGGRH